MPNNWPDPNKPGYPLNPNQDGWHWLKNSTGRIVPWLWNNEDMITETTGWRQRYGEFRLPRQVAFSYEYVGPCLLPTEVAALVAAERETCAKLAEKERDNWFDGSIEAASLSHVANAIRARGQT